MTALLLGAFVHSAVPSTGASAEPVAATGTGVEINQTAASKAADKVEQQTEAFFKCLIAKDIVSARHVVLYSETTKAAKAVKKLSMVASDCLGRDGGYRLTTNYILYSGGIARALYLRSNPGRPAPELAAATTSASTRRLVSTTPAEQAIEAMHVFSDCVVANSRSGSDAFIRANPGSTAEAAALDVLRPVMPGCLTTSDKLALSRESLRAGLSVALYNQYAAASATVATAGTQ